MDETKNIMKNNKKNMLDNIELVREELLPTSSKVKDDAKGFE